jgi:D-beta-D-heptose 7-phosphate kinase/D-beta-D-heptose 1-phosphate adenosyltransferase
MKILVIGDSCIDKYIYGQCNRLCPEAPVPIFTPLNEVVSGGMAQNVVNNINSIANLIGGITCDILTNSNLTAKTRFVDARTNQMLVRVDDTEDNNESINLDNVDWCLYDAIVVSDYNKNFLTQEQLYNISNNHSLTFIDTKRQIGDWTSNYTFIKINQFEYEQSKQYIDQHLLDKTIITLGIDGCQYKNRNYPVTNKIETIDTSGAGDTFLAAFATQYVLQHPRNITRAINYAQHCCSIVISKRGTATI